MKVVLKVLPWILVLMIGYHFGSGSAHTKTKNVYVPGPSTTHTVTRYETKELPKSCVEVRDTLLDTIEPANVFTDYAARFQTVIEELGSANGIDTTRYNKLLIEARNLSTQSSTSATKLQVGLQDFDTAVAQCKKDMSHE